MSSKWGTAACLVLSQSSRFIHTFLPGSLIVYQTKQVSKRTLVIPPQTYSCALPSKQYQQPPAVSYLGRKPSLSFSPSSAPCQPLHCPPSPSSSLPASPVDSGCTGRWVSLLSPQDCPDYLLHYIIFNHPDPVQIQLPDPTLVKWDNKGSELISTPVLCRVLCPGQLLFYKYLLSTFMPHVWSWMQGRQQWVRPSPGEWSHPVEWIPRQETWLVLRPCWTHHCSKWLRNEEWRAGGRNSTNCANNMAPSIWLQIQTEGHRSRNQVLQGLGGQKLRGRNSQEDPSFWPGQQREGEST